ncbi:TPA: hypothetical protein N0F65_002396 [Lagenidium giganteum]|uniref:Protein kinase domain-containing protein n=1 Tax=Lagenidium giganteum TaxID=4803 RepID=A0AAV2YN74_9STRA|nr:TPA: hypothetical protein N0F65_002396 [Lagenidium giganteum]
MSAEKRWRIVRTASVTKRKTADGDKYVNNYLVHEVIGQGRFAKVKMCERISAAKPAGPHRKFAMKIYSKKALLRMKEYCSQADATDGAEGQQFRVVTALDRVRNEITIMESLYHRNIALLFEVIEDPEDDKIYLVMEHMPDGPCMLLNPDTKQFMSPLTHSTLPEDCARAHVNDILKGVEYLHARGVCHRDLKPDNILLNSSGRCHLVDFGCAMQYDAAQVANVQAKDTIGTYHFLASECCTGEPYSPFMADIWAVGVLLFLFLFGKLPFDAVTTKDLFDLIVNANVEELIDSQERPVTALCREFLLLLLRSEAAGRPSASAALDHEWLVQNDNGDGAPAGAAPVDGAK